MSDNWAKRYGPLHSRIQLSYFLQIEKVYEKVELLSVAHYPFLSPFDNDRITLMALIYCEAKAQLLGESRSIAPRIMAIGEVAAVMLPEYKRSTMEEARSLLSRIISHYFAQTENQHNGEYNQITYQAFLEASGDHYDGMPENIPPWGSPIANLQYVEAMGLLEFLASYSSHDKRIITITFIAASYVALAKRGTTSEQFLTKVREGLKTELGVNITLSHDLIKGVYNFYMLGVNDTNAEKAFMVLDRQVPDIALRLKLTIEQSSQGGLTVFFVIREAFSRYPDFSWGNVDILTDGEIAKWEAAATIIGANPYYGFKKDLGEAKATNYKALGYAAKELLIKIGGQISLRQYQGFSGTIKNRRAIDELIETYINKRQGDLEKPFPMDDDRFKSAVASMERGANIMARGQRPNLNLDRVDDEGGDGLNIGALVINPNQRVVVPAVNIDDQRYALPRGPPPPVVRPGDDEQEDGAVGGAP